MATDKRPHMNSSSKLDDVQTALVVRDMAHENEKVLDGTQKFNEIN